MNIEVNIGGAFSQKEFLLRYLLKNKHVAKKLKLTVYDGINTCSWNGGRINRDLKYSDDVINFYYRNNINIALTFTNNIVSLDDEVGNHLLAKFHREGNKIISINTKLRDYIRENFPLYQHTRSITGFGKINVPMQDDDVQMYKKLEPHYDYIVPRTEHTFDQRFKDLDPIKYEIMVNDTCIYNCPYYEQHFQAIAEQNRLYNKPWSDGRQDEMMKIEECWIDGFDPNVGHAPTIEKYGENYGMDLKRNQISRLIKAGIRRFKVTGREMNFDDYSQTMTRHFDMFQEISSHE